MSGLRILLTLECTILSLTTHNLDPANKFFTLNMPNNSEDHKQLLPKKDAFKGRAHRDPHTIY